MNFSVITTVITTSSLSLNSDFLFGNSTRGIPVYNGTENLPVYNGRNDVSRTKELLKINIKDKDRGVLIGRDDVDISLSSFNFEAKDITAEDLLDLAKAEAKITKQILDILEPKIEAKGYYVESTSLDVGQLTIYVKSRLVNSKFLKS